MNSSNQGTILPWLLRFQQKRINHSRPNVHLLSEDRYMIYNIRVFLILAPSNLCILKCIYNEQQNKWFSNGEYVMLLYIT